MRYGQIRRYDVANGPGIRTSIFVTGCNQKCPYCFNQDYQSFSSGERWTEEETQRIIHFLSEDQVDGLSVLGGEPFENTKGLIALLEEIRTHSRKNIWIYSGYTYEELIQDAERAFLLSLCDVLVDGPFIHELKNLRLRFRGSSNQRIIDLNKSRQEDTVILWEEGI